MGCSKSKEKEKQTKPAESKHLEPSEHLGLYILYSNNGLWQKWSNERPLDPIILFIKSKDKILRSKVSAPSEVICQASNEKAFLKGLMQGLLLTFQSFQEIQIHPEASKNGFMPFKIVLHELGNGILGDSVTVLADGDSLQSGLSYDIVAIVPSDTTLFDTSSLKADEFRANVKKCGGHYVNLDASGKVRPL